MDGAEGCGPGEKGAKEFIAVGKVVLAVAPVQVVMDRHEGGEPESGVDHPADKGLGLGRAPGGGESYGPLDAKFLGQRAEPDNGKREGHFTAEGIDAKSDVVHWLGFTSRGLFEGVVGRPEREGIFEGLDIRPELLGFTNLDSERPKDKE